MSVYTLSLRCIDFFCVPTIFAQATCQLRLILHFHCMYECVHVNEITLILSLLFQVSKERERERGEEERRREM